MSNAKYHVEVSILIPCYNEEENVLELRDQLLKGIEPILNQYRMELVLIDDGSTDGTWGALHDAFRSFGDSNMHIKFVRHPDNLGLGAALRTGFNASCGDVVITADSDGTYSLSEIPVLINMLEEASIVTASPYHPEGGVEGVSAYRLILSKGSSFLYRLLVDWNLHTYTSLFRAYNREVLKQVDFKADDFLAGTELLVKARLRGMTVCEMPALLRMRKYGSSKAKIWGTIRSHLVFQLAILAWRLGIDSVGFNIAGKPEHG